MSNKTSNVQQSIPDRARQLREKEEELLDSSELQELWVLLKNSVPADNQTMNYLDFKRVSSLVSSKSRKYFNPSVFARLQDVSNEGRVSIIHFFDYIMRKVWLQQTRIGLSLYDADGSGYLRETDLIAYILELLPTFCNTEEIDSSFHNFYACVAVRKFFFFLDPYRHGKVKIIDILESGFLDDFLELKETSAVKQAGQSNWFSIPNALRVYDQFVALDLDRNGTLSKEEFSKLNGGSLSGVFVDRIYEELPTYDGEMDFRSYVDVILMVENKKEPQALYMYFKMLDIHQKHYIDSFVLNVFVKALQEKLSDEGQETINFEDVCNEIFDMIKPEVPNEIRLNDLIMSGHGDLVVNILTDTSGLWSYENRELFLLDLQEETEI